MKFIKINDSLMVKRSAIEGIEKTDKLKCKIYTSDRVYKCSYPLETIVSMLEQDNDDKKTNQLLESIVKNQQ